MTAERSLLAAVVLGFGLLGLLLMWPTSPKQAGGLSVAWIGLTNDSSGKLLAQFSVVNRCSRRVRFGVCEVQVRQTNGWPNSMRVAGGAEWLAVAGGGERIFSVRAPALETATWRVPLSYQEDLSFLDNVRSRLDLLAWGISRWRPGKPVPVRRGDRFHRMSAAFGPEMLGGANPALARRKADRPPDQTNPGPEPPPPAADLRAF